MIRLRQWITTAALLLFAVPGATVDVAAQDPGAAPDSLGDYLRSMSDSTDSYFGASGAPVDTAGLDSSLAHRLTQPWLRDRPARLNLAPGPWLNFNRADGPLLGGSLRIGREGGWGELQGRLATVTGPNELRGGGRWRGQWATRDEDAPYWTLQVEAGRFTERLDSDRRETSSYVLWVFLSGDDNQSYLRRDGTRIQLAREASSWRAQLAFRTQLETPLSTTATWSLFGATPLDLDENFAATLGRAQELAGTVAFRLPRLPVGVAVEERWSDGALGSDFDYRRLRANAGADVSLGQVVSLVPELEYARLLGEALPQNSFFMGGTRSLRSLEPNLHAGTGRTFARLDAIFVPDLLALARIPHPAAFPIQGAVFTATGAVWGRDVFRATGSAENHWPDPDAWRSEAGISLLYRPGIPDPSLFVRGDLAFPVGPGHESRLLLYFHTALEHIPLARPRWGSR